MFGAARVNKFDVEGKVEESHPVDLEYDTICVAESIG